MPSVTITQSGLNTAVTEGGATDSYTVVLTSQPTADVTITLDNTNGQVTTDVTTLTFTTANWATPQTVTLTAANDTRAEDVDIGVIKHTVTSTGSDYDGIAIDSVRATVTDNDLATTLRVAVFISPATNNPYGLTQAGGYAHPTLVDIDSDGDYDAFIGNQSGDTRYFENTGTATSPAFAPVSTNPFGLANVGSYSTPAFVDIDGDGDLDAFVGNRDGNTKYFENTGSAVSPAFATAVANPFGLTDVGDYAVPTFGDIDGDGDADAFIGKSNGDTLYFENTGTATSPAFAAAVTNPFGLTAGVSYAAPAMVDIDGDGDLDVFVKNVFFKNTGTATSPSFDTGVTNGLGVAPGGYPNPSFADIDGDGDFDAFFGDNGGNTELFLNAPKAPTINSLSNDTSTWPGVGASFALDKSLNATVSDTEMDATNWGSARLVVERVVGSTSTPVASDVFSFNASGFTVSGSDLQTGSTTFATFTSTNGVLTIDFNTSATNALVQSVIRGILYRNDTPTGDTSIRFSLTDNEAQTTTATVTVTSNSIYLSSATDTATIDPSDGVSFSEAVATAATISGSQTLYLSSSIAPTLTGNVSLGENISLNGDAVASGTVLSGGTITIGTLLVFTNASGAAATIDSVLAGAGAFAKAGSGTLTLAGANTYTGQTTVSKGELVTGGADVIADTSAVSVSSGAKLTLGGDDTIGSLFSAGSIVLGSHTLTTGANNTSTGFSGIVSGTGGLTKTGTATFTITGANSYTGQTTVASGTLATSGAGRIADASAVSVASGATLKIGGAETIGSLAGAGNTTLGSNTLTTGGANTSTTYSGVLSGTGHIVKSGSGTWTLSGTSTYSGTTTVNAGSLTVNGALSNTSSVTVKSGATLAGSGSIGTASTSGAVTVQSGATLAPGDGVGSLALKNGLTVAGTLAMELNSSTAGSGYDQIAVTGSVDLTSSSLTLSLGYTPASSDTFTLIDNDGSDAITGTLSVGGTNIVEGGTFSQGGTLFRVSYVGGSGNDLTLSLVPDLSPTIVLADSALAAGETTLVTFTFPEAVTGFSNSSLTIANASLSTVSSSDGGVTWTATLTPTADLTDASNVITVDLSGVANGAGHAGTGTTDSSNYAIDTARPTASIVVADAALVAGETSLVTITFSEAVTGLTSADLTVENGSISSLSSSDGGTTWTATLTPTADVTNTTNVITLDNSGVTDAAGSAGTGTTDSNNYALDTARPTATIVVADTALAAGETSLVTLTFSEAVTGLTSADLTVANGSIGSLSSSDGGITWTATLTPTAALTDTTNVITLDNTGVTDAEGNAGTGTTDSNNYAIDTARPTASIVVADTALAAGESSLVTITFSEAITGLTSVDLTVANGSISGLASSDGGTTWTATLTPTADVTDTTNVITLDNTGVTDAAGNSGSGTTDSNDYAIDTVRPTATIVVADTALAAGETSLVTITFSEAVTGLTSADLTVANGSIGSLSSSDGGTTWTATLTPTANLTDTTNVITLDNTGVANAAGNAGTGTTDSNTYAIDTARPTASIVVADAALAAGETSLVTITFSEAVTGLTSADLTVANGSIGSLSSSDGGITWTATLTPTANLTDTTNVITLDNTGVANAAGNAGTGTTDSNTYAIDTARPTASIVVADAALAAGETSLVTITFSEAVTGLTSADLTAENGSISSLSSSDGGTTWTATLTPTADVTNTTNVVTLDNTGVTDAAGNAGTGTTDSNTYEIDTVRPTATIVVADTALAAGETSLLTITFSEAVTGLTSADLTVANGSIGSLSSSDGGTTWTATLTPTANVTDTTNVVSLDNTGVANAAGNVGTGTTDSNTYAIDTVRPTASIVVADTALAAGETSLVTITFSEAVTGLTSADLTMANGSIGSLSSSDGGITWTATLTPTAALTDTTNVITLDNSGVTDAAGNAGTGNTDSNNYALDTARPTASIVVADTALAAGETSLVTITFSEAVTGLTSADLTVANGSIGSLSSSNGGITWTATLTPTAALTDTTNVITLDNTGVTDAAGNAGTGTTDSNNYAIDTARPTASIVVADTALAAGETSLVTITFSEAITGLTSADLTVANGSIGSLASSDGGITWTATLTPAADITDTTNVVTLDNTGVTDAAGNAGTGSIDSNNYALDTARPTATIVVADTALAAGETSLLTITFSEAVTGLTSADLTVANGSISSLSSSDGGTTWTATLTPTADVTDITNVVTLDSTGVTDAAGNAGTGTTDSNNYAIDTVRPTATIVVADTALAAGETSLVTITFSEAVTGLTSADLTVANGSIGGLASSDGGTTWTATLTPTANLTDTTNIITLDDTGVANAAGNAGTGTTDSNTYAIDTARPTASVVVADAALAAGETSLVTITFSEAVTGLTSADLTVANGSIGSLSSSDGGITWTATLTPTAAHTDTTNVITLDNTGVTDAAGNAGTGSTDSNNYALDTARPTASIVVADTALAAGETSLVTITFSEAVTGLTSADLTVANGSIGSLSSSDGGITWTATLTPTADFTDTTNVITLDNTGVTDAAGNAGTGTTDSNNYAIDTARPTASIVVADTALAAGETSLVTITFSEPVTGLTSADLTVANGSIGGLASSDGGTTWTATLTPTANLTDTTNIITLDDTGVTDAASNSGSGTTDSNNYAIDTVRPTATIVVADTALAAGETSLVTLTFSEAVTGLTSADLTVANGSIGSLSSSDGGTTWTATLTPTADVTDTTNVVTLNNTGVTDAAGNAGTGTTDSNNYALDTARPTATIVVADTALAAGETSLVTITFSEAVTGLTSADLTVANGSIASLSSSNGGITWTATLTPTAALTDATNVITLDNTGVTDAAGNAGTGTTDSNNYAIDTARPTASIVVADTALAVGETSLVSITFSEAITGLTSADLTVANGSIGSLASSDGGITWTASLTPTADITDTANVVTLDNTSVTDAAGNAGTGTIDSNTYAIDTARPTASIVVADTALAAGETSLVTLTFSEAVTGLTSADLTVANGSIGSLSSSDGGITWTATLTPTVDVTDTTNLITLDNTGVVDAAGNAGAGTTDSNSYALDTARPTASIVVADTALAVGETSLVTLTFSEAVTGLTSADLTVANGSIGGLASSDGGITWTATLTPTADVTDTTNRITLDNTGVTDAAGNAGTGTADSNDYAIDTVQPTATIVVADTTLAAGETSLVTITFSEAVAGLTSADLTVVNGSISGLASSDGGTTWTATLTPTAGFTDTTNVITLDNAGVTDATGNAGTGTTDSNNYALDTAPPTASIVVADTALAAGETSLVTLTFSEAVTGLTSADLTVANGGVSGLASTDGGVTWTALFTPDAEITDSSNTIILANSGVTDAAGNAGMGTSDSNNFAIDTAPPTATIVVADTALAAGETSLVTITFSEAVTGLTSADFTVGNGSLSGLASADGGVTWIATLTPAADVTAATNLITLANNGLTDAAGNTGGGATSSNNYRVDTVGPPVVQTIVDGTVTQTQTAVDAATGLDTQILTVPVISNTRIDDPNTSAATLADIPLGVASADGTRIDLAIGLPTGAGVQAEGATTPLTVAQATQDLLARIESATPQGSSVQAELKNQGSSYLASLPTNVALEVQTIKPTVSADTSSLTQPITLTGNATTTTTAIGLVIDTRDLPSDSHLELNNIDFAAVVGSAVLRGGAGKNYVVGDGAAQNILLGPDNDTLVGGGGNDIIGSAGGDDLLDGGADNDFVFGGVGKDTLLGGAGDDILQGGRSDTGAWAFYLTGAGQVIAHHNLAGYSPNASETVQTSELNQSFAELGFLNADSHTLRDLTLLYHAVFHRAPDLGGLSFWANSGQSDSVIADAFLQSQEWAALGNAQLDNTTFVQQVYRNILGREPDAAGLLFWVDHLNGNGGAGAISRTDMVLGAALSGEHAASLTTEDGMALGQDTLTHEQGWLANSGDDRLDGGSGNDTLVGGDGTDTIVYSGTLGDYSFRLGEDGQIRIVDKASGDVDVLQDIELGQFSNGTVDLGFTHAAGATLERIGLVYQATFGHSADLPGLAWWANVDVAADALAHVILATPEFSARFGDLNDKAFVQLLFHNTGMQDTEVGGQAYWETYLADHGRDELVAAWVAAPEVVHAQYGALGLVLI